MENVSFWLQAIISILSGIAVLIPLIVKLVNVTSEAVKEKNWNQMLKLVMSLMETAEKKFDKGADKKEWVISELEALSGTLNYDINYIVISDMIDAMCDMSKELNK